MVAVVPPQKIVGLKLCWIVVRIVWGCCIQNFRPLGPFFLVEVEFLAGGWWGVQSDNHVKPNPKLRLG